MVLQKQFEKCKYKFFYCYFISGVSQLKMVFLTFVNLFYLAVNKTIVYLTTLLFYKQKRCNKRVF